MENPSPMFSFEDEKLWRFRRLERESIARNQWYMGEKLGRPVSWNEAEWNWVWVYRKQWLADLKASGEYPFD